MKLIKLIVVVAIAVGCNHVDNKKHSDHMGMRAMEGHDELGCKNGRVWKQVGDDDWVDIGPVTDSCNCNRKE